MVSQRTYICKKDEASQLSVPARIKGLFFDLACRSNLNFNNPVGCDYVGQNTMAFQLSDIVLLHGLLPLHSTAIKLRF
jgi:hypothetical protein